MSIVDASLVVEFLAPDSDPTGPTHALFERWAHTGESLHAPAMLRLEVMNALLTGVRRGRWDGEAADAAARFSDALPITAHPDDRDRVRAWELARRYDNYPVYEMLYVALAERLAEPLVTLDERLRGRLSHLGWIIDANAALESS